MNIRNIDDLITATPDSHKQAPTIGEAISALTTRQKIIGTAVVLGTLGAAGAVGFFFGTRRTDTVLEDVIEPVQESEVKPATSTVQESLVPAAQETTLATKIVDIGGKPHDQNKQQ